jgi:site-specific DNA-methyltransferase (adenine-specific)/adenine-specific DNA-methyltransferase
MRRFSDEEILEITRLLKNGEYLPADIAASLLETSRKEYELQYAEKERPEDILAETMAVPLQPVKTFGHSNGWINKLVFGDNLQVLKTLLYDEDAAGSVKLIYIDPPFATRQDFRAQEEKAYQDRVTGARFLEFLRKRLIFLRELLSSDGFIFVHMDYRYVHYIKVLLDEIFQGNFRNDIKVPRGIKNVQSQFEEIYSLAVGDDSVLVYSKAQAARLPNLRLPHDEAASGKWDTFWRGTDRPTMRYEIFGQKPNKGQWRWEKPRAFVAKANYEKYVREHSGRTSLDEYYLDVLETTGERLNFVRKNEGNVVQYFVPPREGRVASTLWTDVRTLGRVTEYPTEKHEQLVARIIGWATKPGDLVLDAFAGSGTTLAVAEKMGRRWIGIDCGKFAIYTIQKRMLNLKSEIGDKGKKLEPKPFALYNAGLYDYKTLKHLPWEEYRAFALKLFQCRDETHSIAGIDLDGYLGSDEVLVFNYLRHEDALLDRGYVDDLHSILGTRLGRRFFIIAPAASIRFLEDYVQKDKVRYYVLRIPYSIIEELHSRGFSKLIQPISEADVNATIDAVGFDFIQPPDVDCEYRLEKLQQPTQAECVIRIKRFQSTILSKKPVQYRNLETLSMVMLDYDFEDGVFNLDEIFFGDVLAADKHEIRFLANRVKGHVMIIYMDTFGNEKREIKRLDDFKKVKK